MKIVFATNNAHKLSEVKAVLGDGYEIATLKEVGITEDIPETGATLDENATIKAAQIASDLRGEGIHAQFDVVGRSVKAQMKYADKIGAKYAAVIGENELCEGKCELKDLRLGEKKTVSLDELALIKE